MPTFKTKEKIKSVEINVPAFEEARFVIAPDYPRNDMCTASAYCSNPNPGSDSFKGDSKPFTFDENTVMLDHCKEAYSNLIKNIEKYVEENESC